MSGALAFVAATQGTPFDHLALGTNTVLGWLPTLGHNTDSQLKHTLSLSVKEAYLLFLELQPKGPASALAHSGDRGQWTPSARSPFASLHISGIFQKGTCILIWYPDFCHCCPRDTSRSPGSVRQWDLLLVIPQDCIFTYFKSW